MNRPQHTPSIDAGCSHRRIVLAALIGCAFGKAWGNRPTADTRVQAQASAERVSQHFPFGPVVPARPLRAWPLTTHQGTRVDLAGICKGQITAIQLVFTQCSAICPIQGALFAQAQKDALARQLPVRFLSLSIDPLTDNPASLAKWIKHFDPLPSWLAASPEIADVANIKDLLSKGGESKTGGVDAHPGQVYFVDKQSSMVYRSASLPSVAQIVSILESLA